MKNIIYSIPMILLFIIVAGSNHYYVSLQGNDQNSGSKENPFKTINKTAGIMQPGDTCWIRNGRYHESVIISNMNAGGGKSFVFMPYPGEKVTLDGTEPIESEWKKYKKGIYKTQLNKAIWQLFVDGEMMISARWPNGYLHDGSLWEREKSWEYVDPRSRYGIMYSEAMAKTNIDFSGAIAVMNIGSWRTFQHFVENHSAGKNIFNYEKNLWNWLADDEWFVNKNREGYFYLEGKLECLDSPREWFFDPDTKKLYLWVPGISSEGESLEGRDIRGKTLSYAFDVSNSSYIKIIGIDFFGITFRFTDCHHVTIEDCNFLYPSYSKRMLRDISPMDVTLMVSSDEFDPGYNVIRNCTFEYMDGPAIKMTGVGNLVENCYIHDVDFSCTFEGGWTIHMVNAPELTFRRNTVHTTGASELFKAGIRNLIELNNLSRSGFLQNDGSMVQISVAAQNRSITRNNWVHHSIKQGIRFDNSNRPNTPWGENGTVHHNVAWETQRIFFKGDNHHIYHNLSFDSQRNDLIISGNVAINGYNFSTVTRNNIANTFSGDINEPGTEFPVPGIEDHNWAGDREDKDIRSQLRDPDNLDFRPKAGSELVDAGRVIQGINDRFLGKAPDIGPYEYGDVNYWIPGYQSIHTSTPVPPDGAKNVKIDAELMWLQGYKAESHDVYFGTNADSVENANRQSKEFQGNQKNNIFTPGPLQKDQTYYWRIDAISDKGIEKGKVWHFTVKNDANVNDNKQ